MRRFTSLTVEEIALYWNEQPWGFILFARNLKDEDQIRDLVHSMREAVGRADAPILIDQRADGSSGSVHLWRKSYPSGSILGELYESDPQKWPSRHLAHVAAACV